MKMQPSEQKSCDRIVIDAIFGFAKFVGDFNWNNTTALFTMVMWPRLKESEDIIVYYIKMLE